MEDIMIPLEKVVNSGLTINEYLVLYNVATNDSISAYLKDIPMTLCSLESKGFLKLIGGSVHMRERASEFFTIEMDLFDLWVETYPTQVKTKYGRRRALSPKDGSSILGKRLKKKWNQIFKKNTEAQKQAIKVLELQICDMQKSGELEYMVEATRWLNEGYHEKYSYLLDNENEIDNIYGSEDYM